MLNDHKPGLDPQVPSEELVQELAANTSEAARAMRQATRLIVRARVTVEPASLSMRDGRALQGLTGDVSTGGTQLLLPRPLHIGDVYLITFDRQMLDLPPVYALCLRGRLVRTDAYEAGMRFLEPVTLPASTVENADLI
ncbi:MAG: hypothetical protein KatS3mg103_0215 [Phycisphaerales bacterium]|nr:MAG: hypothetical protein KatS3mg103_0215 [Phycisphaerales bacterium]